MRVAILLIAVVLTVGCVAGADPASSDSGIIIDRLNQGRVFVGSFLQTPSGPTFKDCSTQKTFAVLPKADFDALHRAVSALGRDAESPAIVSVRGGVWDGEFVVTHFFAVWPEESCEKAGVHTTLDNTYWKLVELNGKPVATHGDQRETHIILRTQSNQVGGFGGCNTLGGRYEVNGDRLRFLDLTSTEVACESLDEEQAFFDTLARVTNYQSVGESLQLRDDKGPVARLRAVYFR